jgi:hypothetical protein
MANRKRTNNDLQSITHKTKDRVIRTALRPGGELDMSMKLVFVFAQDVMFELCLDFFLYIYVSVVSIRSVSLVDVVILYNLL